MKRMLFGWQAAASLAPLVGLAGHLLTCTPSGAADLFGRLESATSPAVETSSPPGQPVAPVFEPAEHDLSQHFPNLRMPPLMASIPDAAASDDAGSQIARREFAAIVAEAKREAMAEMRSSRRSVAAGLPGEETDHGTPASFAAFNRPTCRHRGVPAPQACPPQRSQPHPLPAVPPSAGTGGVTPFPEGTLATPSAPQAGVPSVADSAVPAVPTRPLVLRLGFVWNAFWAAAR